MRGYTANYLIDLDNAVIVDVEATTAIRQAEVTAAKRMTERTGDRFDLYPERLAGDSAYGSPPPPRTSGSSPSWSRCRTRKPPEAVRG